MNVVAPMFGKVVSIDVNTGDQVKENDEVATIEAMKMYIKINAPVDGSVKEIKVNPGEAIELNSVIMTLE